MRQRRWVELLNAYDCEIRYHPGKANVVADVLSRKSQVQIRSVRVHTNLRNDVLTAQQHSLAQDNLKNEMSCRAEILLETQDDGLMYYLNRLWIPNRSDLRVMILDEAHKSRYSIHPGADKMYQDLRALYWWPGIQHGIPLSIISDRDARFTARFWESLHEAFGTRLDLYRLSSSNGWSNGADDSNIGRHVEFSCNNGYHASIGMAPFEALYGRKCWSPICWTKVGESQITGSEIIQETTNKIRQIRDNLLAAHSRQKSYADKRRKPLEFEVGDMVLLKVSPWKGVVRFGKKGKLAPRYVGPFKILERIGKVAYKLELPLELSNVHPIFHVSNLRKCLADQDLQVPLDDIRVDDAMHFVEKPVEIMDREVKKIKRSRIPIVKVRWESKRGPEFTWEREDQMKVKYPHLFTTVTPKLDYLAGNEEK
ncbi:hypothetical protein E3N88_18533 [Mikania micrantha]|uniref:Uncharacterized protein n=1 Tax=Mikania micrantha TaxID=192012 RepID=A0A5N6NNL8_9ASTR|nr:hypothetical protein E3N88_18533 [Mikania micrantha]